MSILIGLSTVGPLEDRPHLGKGWLGLHHGYERSLLVELFAERNEEDVYKLPVFNVITGVDILWNTIRNFISLVLRKCPRRCYVG